MFGMKKKKTTNSHTEKKEIKSVSKEDHYDDDIYEVVEKLSESIKTLEETFTNFIKVELKSLKEEIKQRNEFMERAFLLLLEKSSEKKPSAVEAYLAAKNSQAVKHDGKKPSLPG